MLLPGRVLVRVVPAVLPTGPVPLVVVFACPFAAFFLLMAPTVSIMIPASRPFSTLVLAVFRPRAVMVMIPKISAMIGNPFRMVLPMSFMTFMSPRVGREPQCPDDYECAVQRQLFHPKRLRMVSSHVRCRATAMQNQLLTLRCGNSGK